MNNTLLHEITELRCLIKKQKAEIHALKNTILGLPSMVYWKNNDGVYLEENSLSFETRTKYGFTGDIVGINDHDVYFKQTADQYRENDLMVMDLKKPVIREEILAIPNGECVPQLSMKAPVYDENKKNIGVFGQTIRINSSAVQCAQMFFSFPKEESIVDNLKFFVMFSFLLSEGRSKKGDSYQQLTLRERECAYYLLRGATIKGIGRSLNISVRTVETHLENMKNKLRCFSKAQLTNKLFSLCDTLF